jgi:hypothetical protein
MPRACTVCCHKSRRQIERELLTGRPYRSVAKQFAAAPDAVFRHKRHLPRTLVKAEEAKQVAQAESLIEQLKVLNEKARDLAAKAEASGDYRTALLAVRELVRIVELCARLTGELNERAKHDHVHLHLTAAEAVQLAKDLLELEAGDAVPASTLIESVGAPGSS